VLAEGRSDDFRRHWLGTHFFNPPRYLRLLELIPTPETDAAVLAGVASFADRHLGKGVVIAKDSPNFIGNHLALFDVVRALALVAAGTYSIEEIDAITGPPMAGRRARRFARWTSRASTSWPTSSTTSPSDSRIPPRAPPSCLPPFVDAMLARGWSGEKAGQGFYKRVKGADGESQILVIDPATLEYRPQARPKLGALAAAESVTDTGERIAKAVQGDRPRRRVPAADVGPDARVHREGDAVDCPLTG
jgi:3-hydroxyacyl-CoA dehydrogenase